MTNDRALSGAVVLITHKRISQLSSVVESIAESWTEPYIELYVILHDNQPQVKKIVDSINFTKKIILKVNRDEILNPEEAISRNTFEGLMNAFMNPDIAYVTVLEDDICVRKDFLRFNSLIIAAESKHNKFKGINGFSGVKYDPEKEFAYSRFRYGFGWGWTITRKSWDEVRSIWHANFESHWDALIEPYIRCGYVVMPHNSRILNQGFNESATHTIVIGKQGKDLENSFRQISRFQKNFEMKYIVFDLNWRRDLYSFIEIESSKGKFIDLLFQINSKFSIDKNSKIHGIKFKEKFRGFLFRVIEFLSS
jgi:hypothetical protein